MLAAAANKHELADCDDDVDAILAAHGGDARAALRAALDEAGRTRVVAGRVLEHVSEGYVRGRWRTG